MKSRTPKVLHRAGGRALVEHVVETALALTTPDRVFVVTGHMGEKVRDALSDRGVGFIDQAEPKGTGHAVTCGRDVLAGLDGSLVVLYGDCPMISPSTLRELVRRRGESGVAATLVSTVLPDPPAWGRIIHDARGRVCAIVEVKAATPEQLAIKELNAGIYCFDAPLFWKHAGEIQPNNPAREYYLTDMVEILNRAGHAIESMRIDDPDEVFGINDRVELAVADRLIRDRKARQLMLDGVTIEKPETVSIDAQVKIGMDTIIEPFARLLGDTVIGEACRIGAGAIIVDSSLGDRVEVGPYTLIGTSKLEDEVHAGPFARLRMANLVEKGAHIGNFVELKKTRLGPGSKAMHLAYLGDSTLGVGVNVGAGTITCNYDGRHKHQTIIGAGAFIGSNSTIVAPAEIGENAYLAAGSVITEQVPADALAVGRSRQVNTPGWARKRRAPRT
ncbi:MAG: UDP-N-acetylglucosamine diphosphorylase/glucosamine-1-phosphate N-acetyltransferase [Bryobacterales bacterium]|nr:UDP-N-acetylglucosamine diphosphorylase/glucosamine-1-phosphate N-acetyltransferase [Bryobacterales bacterium]